MSLFQISEPGESKVKEACARVAIGIDLGTTNTLVATVRDGDPQVLNDGSGPLIPSVVHYPQGGEPVVGQAAAEKLGSAPKSTIASAKRFVGRAPADIDLAAQMLPYEFAAGDERVIRIDVGDRTVTPIEVSAEILRAAKARAESELGTEVSSAVITVPAYFDDAQRQATKDAGRLAGLEVMRLLAEPTAAALAYGLDQGSQGLYAVYDLGGGTFDISILKLTDGVFEVRATGGDSALGGDDIDRSLARLLLERVPGEHSAKTANEAVWAAKRAKELLSSADSAELEVAGTTVSLTREDLASAAKELLEKTGRACKRALKDAEVRKKELDGVILVGGSTRSPVVHEYVAKLFGKEPLCELNPDQVVALGAASQAHMLVGGHSDVLLLDVIPLSLGVETMGGVVEKLIQRNSTIPARAIQTFTTYADNQTGFDIHVLQGERETASECRSLARFTLRGIPPMVAGMARVHITYAVDADGLLRVEAAEETTGLAASIEVKPSYGLSDEEVERMLLDSFENAETDLAERNLRIERVEGERILAATERAMEVDAELLEDATRDATESAMKGLREAMAGTNHLAIRKAVEALDLASKPFAEKRMNRAIRAAAVGRKVDEVESELDR